MMANKRIKAEGKYVVGPGHVVMCVASTAARAEWIAARLNAAIATVFAEVRALEDAATADDALKQGKGAHNLTAAEGAAIARHIVRQAATIPT